MSMIRPTDSIELRRKSRVWMLQSCIERGTRRSWEVMGEGDLKVRKEEEEIRVAVSGTGGNEREVQRARK